MNQSFKADVVILLIVSILLGSGIAGGLSYLGNMYFSQTISSLVGDYGEFDLLLQAREEVRADTAIHLAQIVDESFPGGKVKEGPTIAGKTNFFIALPAEYKTRAVFENIRQYFSSVPGGAGVGIYTEPRLTVRGVPEGARATLLTAIEEMAGVKFAFLDGEKVGVILDGVEHISAVTAKIKQYLAQYQVLELTFPSGSEPANPIRTGDQLAAALIKQQPESNAHNVSVSDSKDEMSYLITTVMELKRFLASYATVVTLTPTEKLFSGETLVFAGKTSEPPATGSVVLAGQLLIEVTEIQTDGSARGRIIQGDAADFGEDSRGYRLEQEKIGSLVATATLNSPRQALGQGLAEAAKLTATIPAVMNEAEQISALSQKTLSQYSQALVLVRSTLENLDEVGAKVQATTSGLAMIDTARLESQLTNSTQAMDNLIATLEVLKLLQTNLDTSITNLQSARDNIKDLQTGVRAIGDVAAQAQAAESVMERVATKGQQTLATLTAFDVENTLATISGIDQRLADLKTIDTALITAQLQYLAAAIPQLSDEEINRTITVLDKFIAGQVIPSARIQLLVKVGTDSSAAAELFESAIGNADFSVYAADLGVIEPNVQGELLQVLLEVKAILAGLSAIVLTTIMLVLDHSGIMAYMRHKRLSRSLVNKGWRRYLAWFRSVVAVESRYGMAIGTILLTAIFLLSGGGIPYLPIWGVPLVGAVLGLLAAQYAEKISPVSQTEILAGEALGLSTDEILREIVIPSSRPGTLQKLNRRKLKLRH